MLLLFLEGTLYLFQFGLVSFLLQRYAPLGLILFLRQFFFHGSALSCYLIEHQFPLPWHRNSQITVFRMQFLYFCPQFVNVRRDAAEFLFIPNKFDIFCLAALQFPFERFTLAFYLVDITLFEILKLLAPGLQSADHPFFVRKFLTKGGDLLQGILYLIEAFRFDIPDLG